MTPFTSCQVYADTQHILASRPPAYPRLSFLRLPTPNDLRPIVRVVPPEAHLTAEVGNVDLDFFPGPAGRVRYEQDIALRV